MKTRKRHEAILCEPMRRLIIMLALFTGFAVSVAAVYAATGDGTLVVKKGEGALGVPVVQMTITGSVIGSVDYGKVVIDSSLASEAASVAGYESHGNSTKIADAQFWKGSDLKFRAVGGKFTILVYGTGVNVVAVGKGTVKLAGVPDTPNGDGTYSINDKDFVSLPGIQTDLLYIRAGG
jgi:hypothetical protein